MLADFLPPAKRRDFEAAIKALARCISGKNEDNTSSTQAHKNENTPSSCAVPKSREEQEVDSLISSFDSPDFKIKNMMLARLQILFCENPNIIDEKLVCFIIEQAAKPHVMCPESAAASKGEILFAQTSGWASAVAKHLLEKICPSKAFSNYIPLMLLVISRADSRAQAQAEQLRRDDKNGIQDSLLARTNVLTAYTLLAETGVSIPSDVIQRAKLIAENKPSDDFYEDRQRSAAQQLLRTIAKMAPAKPRFRPFASKELRPAS